MYRVSEVTDGGRQTTAVWTAADAVELWALIAHGRAGDDRLQYLEILDAEGRRWAPTVQRGWSSSVYRLPLVPLEELTAGPTIEPAPEREETP